MAQVTQLLATSVIPAPPEAQWSLWQCARQGTLYGAASPTEERPRFVFSSLWAEGALPKWMDISRHPREVRGSPGEADRL